MYYKLWGRISSIPSSRKTMGVMSNQMSSIFCFRMNTSDLQVKPFIALRVMYAIIYSNSIKPDSLGADDQGLISTKGAPRRPMTYDNHPIHPSQSHTHLALKTTSRELRGTKVN